MNSRIMLAVTIDTEADCFDNWGLRYPFEFNGVTVGIKKNLTPLFEEFGVRPSYLCSHEILNSDICVEILKNTPNCELGSHLHWHDSIKYPYINGQSRFMMQGMENFYAERMQIKALTDLFKQKFSYAPVSFRAGRFGAGINTGKILMENGYKIDSSIAPHIRHLYRDKIYFPDQRQCFEVPYFIGDNGNIYESGNSDLLEIPVTIRKIKRICHRFPLLKINRYNYLRPVASTLEEMEQIAELAIKNSENVLVMMFHNVEYSANTSPYAKTEADVQNSLSTLRNFFMFCQKNNIEYKTLKEIYDFYKM